MVDRAPIPDAQLARHGRTLHPTRLAMGSASSVSHLLAKFQTRSNSPNPVALSGTDRPTL